MNSVNNLAEVMIAREVNLYSYMYRYNYIYLYLAKFMLYMYYFNKSI